MPQKYKRPSGFLVSPFIYIAAALVFALVLLIAGLYYYPEITIVGALVLALVIRQTVKKKHLTFFDESYSPDLDGNHISQVTDAGQEPSEEDRVKNKSTF